MIAEKVAVEKANVAIEKALHWAPKLLKLISLKHSKRFEQRHPKYSE